MSEQVIQVDEKDNIIGPIDRLKAHLGDGILHRGLVVIVKNEANEILMTQRSMKRPDLNFPPSFPDFWDVTLAGHPRWGQNDYVTQMGTEVLEELGLDATGRVEYIGKFQYHAPDPTYPNAMTGSAFRLSEREICGVGILHTNENPTLNPVELQASMWVASNQATGKMKGLKMAPWASLMIERFPQVLQF
jgi:isopentenyl-diphosphate delta-isomerase